MAVEFGGTVSVIATIGCIWWLHSGTTTPQNKDLRTGALMAAAFFKGASLGGFITPLLWRAPGLVVTAFLGTSAVFLCFAAAATLSPRRLYMYLGGMLSSLMTLLFTLRFSSLFFAGAAMYGAELYLGLAAFAGYVIVDTQARSLSAPRAA